MISGVCLNPKVHSPQFAATVVAAASIHFLLGIPGFPAVGFKSTLRNQGGIYLTTKVTQVNLSSFIKTVSGRFLFNLQNFFPRTEDKSS